MKSQTSALLSRLKTLADVDSIDEMDSSSDADDWGPKDQETWTDADKLKIWGEEPQGEYTPYDDSDSNYSDQGDEDE